MKKFTIMLSALLLVSITSCEVESLDKDVQELSRQDLAKKGKPNDNVEAETPADIDVDLANLNDACVTVNLIAGQHHVAGDISVYNDGENLIIIYDTSNTDWTIGKTHLQIGDCGDGWAPLTRGGNPKIGHFDYTEPYSVSENEVVYVIPLSVIGEEYCFAAHAEVQGPTGGETAWGEGAEFEGNSWAMFVKSTLSQCPETGDDGGGDDDDQTPV